MIRAILSLLATGAAHLFCHKKEAQDVADRLNLRGTGCVEYKVFKE